MIRILFLTVILCACGTDQEDRADKEVCGTREVDPYFVEYVNTVRDKILETGTENTYPIERLDYIKSFQWTEMKQTGHLQEYGLNRASKLYNEERRECNFITIARMETLPKHLQYQGAVDHIIMHEIMHVFLRGHKTFGLMAGTIGGKVNPHTRETVIESLENFLIGGDNETLETLEF